MHSLIEKDVIETACLKLAEEEGWAILAVKGEDAFTPDEDGFHEVIAALEKHLIRQYFYKYNIKKKKD